MQESLEIKDNSFDFTDPNQEKYIRSFGKINICHSIVFLNAPNLNLLPEIEIWCKKHNCVIEKSSYKSSIRIAGPEAFNFREYIEVLELFSF